MPENFAEGLNDNTRQKMIGLLNERLADTIDLTTAVKQAHWNLKGPGFIGVHELLDVVADHLRECADLMAERAVILGGFAKGTIQIVASETTLEPYPTNIVKIKDHVTELTERFRQLGKCLRDAIETAGEAGDEDTADLFTGISRTVDKDAWFIGANAQPK
uniref:DNA starvation/stationary phase protection protein Dps n=1 Tax=Pararhizobium sp. IMCC3301 TaxID=3067904 RepID=UPI002740D8DD|nr:DNA starvation/stationary phase protection protein Dps [Pararhizobium sp. IMCC3301]